MMEWQFIHKIHAVLTVLQDGESGRCPEGFSAVPEGRPAARGRSVSSEAGRPFRGGAKSYRTKPGASAPGLPHRM